VRAPLERLARDRFWRTFVELLALNAGISLALMLVGHELGTSAAPNGIISLQLAGSEREAEAIVQSWESAGVRDRAAFSLGLDYLYMPIYAAGASFLGAKLALAARGRNRLGLAGWAAGVAWLPWLAAALDATENAAALEIVLHPTDVQGVWTTVMKDAALVKYGLLGVVIGFLAAGTLVVLLRRAPAPRE
jgi:hypothetical protein